MAQRNAINSNETELRIAEEISYGVVDGTAVWRPAEPNSYGNFGGRNTTVARAPINANRRMSKGSVTDREATAEFQVDMTQHALDYALPGLMFANWNEPGVEIVTAVDLDTTNPDEYEVVSSAGFIVGNLVKGKNFTNSANNTVNPVTAITGATVEVATGTLVAEAVPPATAQINVVGHQFAAGDIDIVVAGDFATIVSTVFDFTTLTSLRAGQWIYVGGDTIATTFNVAANNGFKRLRSIAAHAIVVDKSVAAMVAEDNSTTSNATMRIFFGKTIRDEDASAKAQHSFQLERNLGAPDGAAPTLKQFEYVEGAILNELTINVPTADKITVDENWIPARAAYRTAAQGPKAGTRPALVSEKLMNTSTHFSEIKLAVVNTTNENSSSFFSYLTELTMSFNNNAELQKAVGAIGGFDVSTGDFEVSVGGTGYFQTVDTLLSIAGNADLTLHAIVVAYNAGWAVDYPLTGAGGDPLTVEKNGKIMQPLNIQAGSGAEVIGAGFEHQVMFSFFEYLPNAATPSVS